MNRRLSLLSTAFILPLLLAAALVFVNQAQAGSAHICAATCTYSSIQEAVDDDATVGTTLTIAAETFSENVEITRSVTLVGAGAGATIIDGQAADTVVLIADGANVSISGLTIQNGETTAEDGGGLRNESSTVTLADSVVEDNFSPNGAGIANDGEMVLDNVIVRNNLADEIVANVSICEDCSGGGIYNTSVMTITNNSTIHGNSAKFGGGIENENSAILSVTDSEIYDNTAVNNPGDPDGAGGGVENAGTMTLTTSIVRDNDAPIGAGIANEGTLTVVGSDVYDNIASIRGGGLNNSFNLTVQTSNIYGNEAGADGGGGISSEGGTVIVEQTAVYNNSSTGSGGGIVHNVIAGANSFMLTNSTLSGNSTSGTGGGIRNAGVATTNLNNVTLQNNQSIVSSGQSMSVLAGTLTTKNSLIATNQSGANCSGVISSDGYNIADDDSCGLTGTADFANTNPQLGALQDNGGDTLTHALLPGSPAINSGSGCPAVDQRGVARPFGSECDRGAYEFDQDLQSVYLPFVIRP